MLVQQVAVPLQDLDAAVFDLGVELATAVGVQVGDAVREIPRR